MALDPNASESVTTHSVRHPDLVYDSESSSLSGTDDSDSESEFDFFADEWQQDWDSE
jgi:hypothetical protein